MSGYNPDEVMDALQREDYEFVLREALPHASAGDPAVQCMISLLYQCGFGVGRDLTKAEVWLVKAATQTTQWLGTTWAPGMQ